MADSSITWTDKVWNPTVGCTRESEGCVNCYAEQYAFRLARMGQSEYQGLTRKHADGTVNWTGEVRLLPSRLDAPSHWKKPARIFVDSMSDLFHPDVPDEYIREVFAEMLKARWHTYQILTKRPQRMRELLSQGWWVALGRDWQRHIWLGTSTENQEQANLRIPELLATPGGVHFISAEPLIGPIILSDVWRPCPLCGAPNRATTATCVSCWGPPLAKLDWVIAGAESGPRRRPYDEDWARSLRDECQSAGVAFFYKQGAGRNPGMNATLDGEEWHQFPESHSSKILA